MKRSVLTIVFALCLNAHAGTARADANTFPQWLNALRAEARQKGISESTISAALDNISFLPRVIELDRKQPEGKMTFAAYKQRVISQARIDKGREMYRQHRQILDSVGAHYGVPASVIVALWGIETSYGDNTGGFSVVEALATLAHDGRRSEFFRDELFNALKIIDQGHISASSMKGSWAGAMGQNQFMPSSFHAYAVDGNGDGRRDIWTSLPDVFASTANYLSKSGWRANEKWGRKVLVPETLPQNLTGRDVSKPLSEWARMGIKQDNGAPLPVAEGIYASVILPDGKNGPAYLAYSNYNVIMKWNRSVYFATSVGILSDLIAQQP